MSHSEHHHHGADLLHPATPTDLLRYIVTPPPEQDFAKRLGIITTMRTLMARRPSPELVTFVKDQLQFITDPQVRAFMQLIVMEDPRYRGLAEEALKQLEHQLQEDQVRLATAVTHPLAPPAEEASGIDMMAALTGFATAAPPIDEKKIEPVTAKVLPFTPPATAVRHPLPWHTTKEGVPSIAIPATDDPQGPKNLYSYISPTLAVDQPINSVAGLVIGIKGQADVEHGFGFYLPLPSGSIKLDYTGQTRNIIKIAMSLPETIALYDDHRGPHLGGISNFFTIFEAMRDGYRFLLDLEIIPLNGRYMLSILEAIHIDRRAASGQPAYVSSVHLNKLAHACSAIGFHAFTGEVDYHE